MSDVVVAKRYARALFDLAMEQNALESFENDLVNAQKEIANSEGLLQFLAHPKIDTAVKKEKINNIFAGKISNSVLSLVLLLIERRREGILPTLLKEFVAQANEARGIADAVVVSAAPLGNAEVNTIATQFGRKIGKSLRVQNVVDPSVIGGIVIRIGDRLYDGSVAGKLARFKQSIVQS
jgi:F-type H+-transporting ATPase subunit delta